MASNKNKGSSDTNTKELVKEYGRKKLKEQLQRIHEELTKPKKEKMEYNSLSIAKNYAPANLIFG